MDQSGAHSHHGRILLFAGPSSTGMHYYYADELPRYILLFKVLTVLCFVFTTPLSLLCCLPIIFTLKKVWHAVSNISCDYGALNMYVATVLVIIGSFRIAMSCIKLCMYNTIYMVLYAIKG